MGQTTVPAEGYSAADRRLGLQTPLALAGGYLVTPPKKEMTATLECSGNGAGKTFRGAIGNAIWTGTPLDADH